MEAFDALPEGLAFRVAWRGDNLYYVSTEDDVELYRQKNQFDSETRRYPICMRGRKTGLAVAFNSEKVLVFGDNNKVYIVSPECLVRLER